MARTVSEIEQYIISQKEIQPELAGLTSSSRTSLWGRMVYIMALAIYSLEKLLDIFKIEVDETISKLKPHSLRWYAEKSKLFQYGYDLLPETDYYDNSNLTDDQVQNSRIISYAAVIELTRGLRIKVAKTAGTDLGPLDSQELDSFIAYMKEVKDAGVKLNITSTNADSLLLDIKIIFDPLVINSLGQRIDGTSLTPVPDAIRKHLRNLPFNGVFSVQKMVDAIQAVEGVVDLNVNQVQSKYGALPFTSVNISVVPDSGYLRIDDADLTLTYQAYS